MCINIYVFSRLGSIMGGTLVTINGDGFTPGDTRLVMAGTDYTSLANISYTQIVFMTPSQQIYVNVNLSVIVTVGTNQAVCSLPPCTFQWSTAITPYLDSVSPNQTSGPTMLTLTGRNLNIGGGMASNTIITIGDSQCNITSMTNTVINCQTGSISAGNYTIAGLINGMFSFVIFKISQMINTITYMNSNLRCWIYDFNCSPYNNCNSN